MVVLVLISFGLIFLAILVYKNRFSKSKKSITDRKTPYSPKNTNSIVGQVPPDGDEGPDGDDGPLPASSSSNPDNGG